MLTQSQIDMLVSNPYRRYVDKNLKVKGLRKTMISLQRLIRGPLRRAKIALERPAPPASSSTASSSGKSNSSSAGSSVFYHPHLASNEAERFCSHPTPSEDEKELTNFGTWNPEFLKMSLPSFRAPYLFLCRVPLDVVHECLKIRLEQKPQEPSELSIRQVIASHTKSSNL